MLNLLNNIGRNVIRTSLVNNPVYALSSQRVFFSDEIKTDETSTKTLSGFAKAFEKFEKPENLTEPKLEDNATFLSLLRNSKFIDVSSDSSTDLVPLILIQNFPEDGRSTQQNCYRQDISHRGRRFVH